MSGDEGDLVAQRALSEADLGAQATQVERDID